MCWMDIEAFRSIPAIEKAMRNYKAKQIRKKFLNKKYFFGPNSPASKEARRQTLCAGGRSYGSRLPARPSTPVLREAQKHVRSKLEKVWSIKFTKTPEFLSRNGGCSQLRKSRTNISILQSQTAMVHNYIIQCVHISNLPFYISPSPSWSSHSSILMKPSCYESFCYQKIVLTFSSSLKSNVLVEP